MPFSSIRAYDGIASKIMFCCAVLSMRTDQKPAGSKRMTLQSRDPMEQILTDNKVTESEFICIDLFM